MSKNIVYRLALQLRNDLSPEIYTKGLNSLTTFEGFSRTGEDEKDNTTEYQARKGGKNKCTLQINPRAIAMETSLNANVDENTWNLWTNNLVTLLDSEMGVRTHHLAFLALVEKYRISREGNHYEFLGNDFILNSPLCKLIAGEAKVYDIDYTIKTLLEENLSLFVRITSNQRVEQVIDKEFDANEDKLIFEFHCVRIDPKIDISLSDALNEQKEKLHKWLNSGKLDIVTKTIENA